MDWSEMTGRERDALIATAVMGWPEIDDDEPYRFHVERGGVVACGVAHKFTGVGIIPRDWRPTENVADAWDVVEKMRAEGWRVRLQNDAQHPEYEWRADFHDNARPFVRDGHHVAGGSSAPDAICRCALRAKGVEV